MAPIGHRPARPRGRPLTWDDETVIIVWWVIELRHALSPRLSRDAVMQRYVRHRGGLRLLWYDEKKPTARAKPHGTFVRASKLREAYAKAARRLEQYPDFKERAVAALREPRLTHKLR